MAGAGRVYSAGSNACGQLGVGVRAVPASCELTLVEGPLRGRRCVAVGTGTRVSFAVTDRGLYGHRNITNDSTGCNNVAVAPGSTIRYLMPRLAVEMRTFQGPVEVGFPAQKTEKRVPSKCRIKPVMRLSMVSWENPSRRYDDLV